MSDSLWPHEPQHTRPPRPSPTRRVHLNPCALCWRCHPTISSSVVPFSSCPQSFPASGSFQMSQHSKSCGQSIGVSASASVLLMNIQDWFSLGVTGLIFLAVQGTLKSLLQHHSSKESILWCSAFFIVQLSHPYMTTGKMIALTFIGLATKQQQKSLLGYMPIQYVGTLNKRLIQHQACQDLNCLRKGKYWNKANLGLRNEINFIRVQENVAEV